MAPSGLALSRRAFLSSDGGLDDVRDVPPMRKLWMTEDHRMVMFDALSLVFTYYAKEHIRPG